MTRDRKARLLTIAALGLALAIAVCRNQLFRSSTGRPPSTPQDAIYAMLDASRAGDVRAYLARGRRRQHSLLSAAER
jgi:hypothetical protein